MALFNVILKRVERRMLREVENASVKKIKASLFGEKEEKIELQPMIQYNRVELTCLDYLGFVSVGGKDKKGGKKLYRDLTEAHNKLVKEEKNNNQEEIVKLMSGSF